MPLTHLHHLILLSHSWEPKKSIRNADNFIPRNIMRIKNFQINKRPVIRARLTKYGNSKSQHTFIFFKDKNILITSKCKIQQKNVHYFIYIKILKIENTQYAQNTHI